MQTVIHFAQSSGNSEVWTIDPKDDQDIGSLQIKDEIDRSSDEAIVASIRRIDATVFSSSEPWDVKGVAHTAGTTTIEACDPVTMMSHTYTIMW